MITLSSVSKDYGSFRAVHKISLEMKEGEITGLLGPNGAGKTTTMRMITGYFRPSEGRVLIDGVDVCQARETVQQQIGYLPESPPLYQDMLCYDYLSYIAGVRQVKDPRALEKTADICGIRSVLHKKIGELSKGYKQRVGLAQAIIHDPKILILDEPTSGLDPNQIAEVRSLIKEIGKTKTVILSTHILQEVEALADRVIIINQGEIVEDNSVESLQAARGGRYAIHLSLGGGNIEQAETILSKLEGASSVSSIEGEEGLRSFRLEAEVGKDIRPRVFETVKEHGWILYEMRRDKHSLEAIFRELTRGGEHV